MTKSLQEYMKRIQFFYIHVYLGLRKPGWETVISLNFSCLSFLITLSSYVDLFFFGCSVIRDLCRNGCREIWRILF